LTLANYVDKCINRDDTMNSNKIFTKPPINPTDFQKLIDSIENHNTFRFDVKEISTIVKMAYYTGLKREELAGLSCGDVLLKGKKKFVSNSIKTKKRKVCIDADIQEMLKEYLDHLKNQGLKTNKKSPLFPNKDGGDYDERRLSSHINKFTRPLFRRHFGLDRIRQSGICKYYDDLIGKGVKADQALEKTAKFAGSTIRHMEGLLSGRIQPAGKEKRFEW
jgi:integrase